MNADPLTTNTDDSRVAPANGQVAIAPPPESESKDIVGPSLQKVTLVQTFEFLTKGWVLLLAAIYASGYIVISIYHASLGLNEINPLRPKVAAAGLLFLALATGAVYIQRYATTGRLQNPNLYESESQRRYLFASSLFLLLYLLDSVASTAVGFMMRYEISEPNWALFFAVLLTGCILIGLAIAAEKSKPSLLRLATHGSFLSLYVIIALVLVALSIQFHGEFGFRQLALFLWTIQLAALEVNNLRSKNKNLGLVFSSWQVISLTMLAPLLLFAIWVYPHTAAAFGGGEPTTEMSVLSASGGGTMATLSVKLVDETDAGFYVMDGNNSRVRYIPRNLVTSVIFDKPKGLN